MDAEDFVRRVIRADRYRPISSDELSAFADELRAALEAARAEERERCANTIDLAVQYGGIDGSHHKAWVIDQMVRALCGGEQIDDSYSATEKYRKVVADACNGADGPETYDWDEGIAP